MTRVASLGMYDMPHLRAANDALWAAVAARLTAAGVVDVPAQLDRTRPLGAIWRDDDLLLAQTCGYPLVSELAGIVRPVAAPVYDLPGCSGATHRSAFVVAAGTHSETLSDLRGARVAINGFDSNTGMNLLRAAVAEVAGGAAFFAAVVVTGAHLASLAAVANGDADIAAIDVVTIGLARAARPDLLAGVRLLGWSLPSPSLPFVTRAAASEAEVALLRAALADALADPALAAAVEALALREVVAVSADDYAVLTRYAEQAAAAGYPTLA